MSSDNNLAVRHPKIGSVRDTLHADIRVQKVRVDARPFGFLTLDSSLGTWHLWTLVRDVHPQMQSQLRARVVQDECVAVVDPEQRLARGVFERETFFLAGLHAHCLLGHQ